MEMLFLIALNSSFFSLLFSYIFMAKRSSLFSDIFTAKH